MTAFYLDSKSKVQYEKKNGDIETVSSASISNEIPNLIEASFEFEEEAIDNEELRQKEFDYRKPIKGNRSWSGNLTLYATSHGSPSSGSSQSISGDFLSDAFKSALGGQQARSGSNFSSVTDGGNFDLDSTVIEPGMFIWAAHPTSGTYEGRPVLNKSGNTYTLAQDFSFSPSSGSVVYGSETHYLKGPSDNQDYMNFYWQKQAPWRTHAFAGGKANLTFTFEHGTPVRVALEYEGTSHNTGSSDAMIANTVSTQTPILWSNKGGVEVLFTDAPTSTSDNQAWVCRNVHTLTIPLNLSYADVTSQKGIEGVVRKILNDEGSISEFTVGFYDEDASHYQGLWDDFNNQTEKMLTVNFGTTPGNLVGLSVRRAVIMSISDGPNDPASGYTVTCNALKEDVASTDTSGVDDDLVESPFVVSRG